MTVNRSQSLKRRTYTSLNIPTYFQVPTSSKRTQLVKISRVCPRETVQCRMKLRMLRQEQMVVDFSRVKGHVQVPIVGLKNSRRGAQARAGENCARPEEQPQASTSHLRNVITRSWESLLLMTSWFKRYLT